METHEKTYRSDLQNRASRLGGPPKKNNKPQWDLLIDYLEEHGEISAQEVSQELLVAHPMSCKSRANQELKRRGSNKRIISKKISISSNPFAFKKYKHVMRFEEVTGG